MAETKTARTVLVLGPSGRGKSTSIRNLPKDSTLVFNIERKALPFKDGKLMPQIRPKTVKELFDFMDKYAKNAKLKTVVFDSFSAFSDLLVEEARILKAGWDVWTHYNMNMRVFFNKIRAFNDSGIHTVCLGHDESLDGEEGSSVRRLKCKGKEWEGVTEKEFDVILWADIKMLDETTAEHSFITQTNGVHPGKSPIDMLPLRMPNDLNEVIKLIEVYDA
jgi:hypothetical protein